MVWTHASMAWFTLPLSIRRPSEGKSGPTKMTRPCVCRVCGKLFSSNPSRLRMVISRLVAWR